MIVVTGATGNTGSKIIPLLLEKGLKVRAISRSLQKIHSLWGNSVEAAIGDLGDVTFLADAFHDAEAVYLLIPPKMDSPDIRAHYNIFGNAAIHALRINRVTKVVFLSSLGAELAAGTGPVLGLHDVEAKLSELVDTNIAILRPAYFMENTLMNLSFIKEKKINGNSIAADAPICLIATKDIASQAAKLLAGGDFSGHVIYDLFGDRLTYAQITRLIGKALGIKDVPYQVFSAENTINSFTAFGVSRNVAASFVEMGDAISRGLVKPTTIDPEKANTPTTFSEFIREAARGIRNAEEKKLKEVIV